MWLNDALLFGYTITYLFIYWWTSRSFHLLTIVNSVANKCTSICFNIGFSTSEDVPRNGADRSDGSPTFNFLRNKYNFFSASLFHIPTSRILYVGTMLILSHFLMIAVLVGMKRCFIVVLICILFP